MWLKLRLNDFDINYDINYLTLILVPVILKVK